MLRIAGGGFEALRFESARSPRCRGDKSLRRSGDNLRVRRLLRVHL